MLTSCILYRLTYFVPGVFGGKVKCTGSLGSVDRKGRCYAILLQHLRLGEPEPVAIPRIVLACSCSLHLGHEEDKTRYVSTDPQDLGHSSR